MEIRQLKSSKERTERSTDATDDNDSLWTVSMLVVSSPWKFLSFLSILTGILFVAFRYDMDGTFTNEMDDVIIKSASSSSSDVKGFTKGTTALRGHDDTAATTTPGSTLMTPKPSTPTAVVQKNPDQQVTPPTFYASNAPLSEHGPNDPLTALEVSPSHRYHVFQFSGTGVASTLTVNLVTGLFEGKDVGMAYWECKFRSKQQKSKDSCTWWQRLNKIKSLPSPHLMNTTIVTKTHVEDADLLLSWFQDDFDHIFFVGNERKDQNKFLPHQYCANDTYPNVLCLEYNDLQYNDEAGLRKVVKYVKERIYESFPYFANVKLKEEEAVQRLLGMAESYKGTPGYDSNRYGIGGGNAKSHTLEPASTNPQPPTTPDQFNNHVATTQEPSLDHLEVAPSRKYHIFQFSPSDVGSTLTVNLLLGLFEGVEQGMAYWECKATKEKNHCTWWQRLNKILRLPSPHLMNTTIVTKTHVEDADLVLSWFQDDFDHIFFVGNERKDQNKFLPHQYCANDTYPNVLCLEYNDLQYNDEAGLRKVVKYVKERIYESFPYFANVKLKEEEAVQRLLDMSESYKGTPGYDSNRYGIGGGKSKSHTLEPPNKIQDGDILNQLEVAPSRQYHVFQFSGTGVASTMTVNLLIGLFEGADQGMAYWECKHKDNVKEECTYWNRLNHISGKPSADLINSTIVTKTHVENVDILQSWFGSDFDKLFFVGNERKDVNKFLPKEYCDNATYPNVLCLEYNDLHYDNEESLRKVVKYVKDRIQRAFPYFANVHLKEEEAVQRLLDMAESYNGTPGYDSNRYGIGGGNARNHTLDGGA
ncbi:hypothetical protein IV203_010295 [Nitzschia inconspicua]|uniref:Sulfotransferase domain-containing protein n=1 Tax=Nitzschia inconspicua TaxID=303405 RepID=A0A9K3PKM5_9STRA|nr:hypothetical protein IV203_010295 [Nitzschia inconspicua]